MESVVVDGNGDCSGGGGRVVTELSHIMELVRQLEVHLGGSQTQEECRRLASQISSLTERSIALITSYSLLDAGGRKRPAASPLSDASDAPFKTTKKRRTRDKVKHQVRVSAGGGGGENPADDGHSWRKYGQKEILGAKYPRGYYRCTHRHSQGCAATKQVQRADEDPTLFDVVYLGDHTCVQNGAAAAGKAASAAAPTEHNTNAHSLLQSLSSSLTVKTVGLAAAAAPEPPQVWIAAAATSASPRRRRACLQAAPAELSPFSAPSTSENWGVSPATSDSNQHAAASFPPFEAGGGGDMRFEFGEVVSALADVPGDDFDISSFFA